MENIDVDELARRVALLPQFEGRCAGEAEEAIALACLAVLESERGRTEAYLRKLAWSEQDISYWRRYMEPQIFSVALRSIEDQQVAAK